MRKWPSPSSGLTRDGYYKREVVWVLALSSTSAYIEGKIRTRQWTGEFGEKHYTTEIIARELQLMGGKHENHAQPPESHVESSDIAADDNKSHVASEDIKPSTIAQPDQKDFKSDAADDIPF